MSAPGFWQREGVARRWLHRPLLLLRQGEENRLVFASVVWGQIDENAGCWLSSQSACHMQPVDSPPGAHFQFSAEPTVATQHARSRTGASPACFRAAAWGMIRRSSWRLTCRVQSCLLRFRGNTRDCEHAPGVLRKKLLQTFARQRLEYGERPRI